MLSIQIVIKENEEMEGETGQMRKILDKNNERINIDKTKRVNRFPYAKTTSNLNQN